MTQEFGSAGSLRVVVSLDVEEEGLFSGRYAVGNATVSNVALLPRLAPLTRELGFPLTLLCTHAVFTDPQARVVLARMRDSLGAEIGAHLHHWNTPPLSPEDLARRPATAGEASPPLLSVSVKDTPPDLLRARLGSLLRAGRDFQGAPLRSFRMGRWDFNASMFAWLAEEGITADSSICPLRLFPDAPDHFLAPAEPWWTDSQRNLLEVPITQIPLHPLPAKIAHAVALGIAGNTARPHSSLDRFRFFGALSANPVWHRATIMRLAAKWHMERGGRVLCLFWHSSEMLPGASPRIASPEDADALFRRIYDFLRWLKENCGARGVTLSELRADAPDFGPLPKNGLPGDWQPRE